MKNNTTDFSYLKLDLTKKSVKKQIVLYSTVVGMFLFSFILVQTGLSSRLFSSLLVPVCVNIILAVSLNLTVGFLGELTLGHAGFMSVGAYASCLFSIYTQDFLPTLVRFPLAMITGGIVAAVFGVIIGIPVLRLKGDYLAIVTLAFGEIIRNVIEVFEFTGGPSGLKGTPKDSNYIIAFAVVMITLIIISNLIRSKHGRAIKAIRDNAIAAESSGINVTYYKMLAFVVAAFFAGVAGAIYGHNLSILTPSTFGYNKSIDILVFVVLGGMGSIYGSVIAATVLTVLPELLRGVQDYRMITYAVLLIFIMIINSSPKFAPIKQKLSVPYWFNFIKEKIASKRAGKSKEVSE